jgi:hypothetical protein
MSGLLKFIFEGIVGSFTVSDNIWHNYLIMLAIANHILSNNFRVCTSSISRWFHKWKTPR